MAKRKVNEDLNLSPFIDLFSTLVVFLLLTAVWNQLSSLTTNIESSTSSDTPPPKEKKVSLGLTIFRDHVQLLEDNKATKINHLTGGMVNIEQVVYYLQDWRSRYPERKDITLNTANTTSYGQMIHVFDTLVGQGFPEVGVNTQ